MSNFLAAAKHTLKPPLPHQQAAWTWAWEQFSPAQRSEFLDLFRADPPLKNSLAYEPALDLIRTFEGFSSEAYPDPITNGAPYTIGYGFTRWPDGPEVRLGETISREQAEWILSETIHDPLVRILSKTIPGWRSLPECRQCALISFAWNVGFYFYGSDGFETITRCLKRRDYDAVPGALLLYVNPGSSAEHGLRTRRVAEGQLWGMPGASGVHLKVPYELQHDNDSNQGFRECLSSSCAMLAGYWSKISDDDSYNAIRCRYGDTTNIQAQIETLRSLGLQPRFITNATPAHITSELKSGRPVAVGWLHQGAEAPSGFGHWSVCVGFDEDHYVMHDPAGEADLVNGGYLAQSGGADIRYSKKNFERRWMPDGPGTGWLITVKI